ncbi:hypothetical protein M0R01_00060 [bacterium]|nr:hypothetical protein [bacterium]
MGRLLSLATYTLYFIIVKIARSGNEGKKIFQDAIKNAEPSTKKFFFVSVVNVTILSICFLIFIYDPGVKLIIIAFIVIGGSILLAALTEK